MREIASALIQRSTAFIIIIYMYVFNDVNTVSIRFICIYFIKYITYRARSLHFAECLIYLFLGLLSRRTKAVVILAQQPKSVRTI